MNKQTISFTANEQELVRNGGECHYSSNKVSYIEAVFDLGTNWDSFDSVRAIWFTDFVNGISTVLDADGTCIVPSEVLKRKCKVNVNLVGSIVENDVLTDRLTSYPITALVVDANAKVEGTETAELTPSQFEQFVSIVQDAVANIKDIVSTTLNADYTLTFVYSDGTSYTTPSIRGERGPQGADGADGTDGNGIASAVLNSNYTLTLTFTDGTSYTTPSIRGAQGPKGDPGDVSQAQLDAAVSDLKSEINQIDHFNFPYIINECEIGYINRSTGADDTSGANDYYVRTIGLQYNKSETRLLVGSDYAIYIYYYKGDGTYISSTDPITNAEAVIPANSYVRISLRYNPAILLAQKDVAILKDKLLKHFDFAEISDLDKALESVPAVDITDPNWATDGNYITNGFMPLDISQDYFLYVPKGLSVLVLLKSDGASTGDLGWFTESHILSFSNLPFDIFTKFALKALTYNGYDTSADNAYPKLLKVGENKNVKTITFDMTKSGYVSTETGTITTVANEYWGISDYIAIPHNTKTILTNVRYRSSVPFGYAIYDQNKNFLRGGQSNRIPVKNTDRYIVVCDAYSIPNHPSTHNKRTVCFVGNDSAFSNTIIAFSGDSVTFGYNDELNGLQLDNTWVNQVANNLGVKQVYNYGVSSASLMRDEDTPIAIIDAYVDYENSINLIGFMIGINDAYRGYPFGTVNDATENTFLGCMNALCVGIVNKWKPSDGKSVFIMLYPQADQTLINRPDVQYKGLTGWDAWNEAVKDVAGKYAIPVCDLYHNLGITPHLDANNVYWGGTPARHSAHPTQIGADVIARYVSNWVKRTFELK